MDASSTRLLGSMHAACALARPARTRGHFRAVGTLSPTVPLRSIGVGCRFDWVSEDAEEEADGLLDQDPMARGDLQPLIARMKQGKLRKGKEYKQFQMVKDEPPLYELTLDTTRPRLRLYFIEESHEDGVHAIGLLLAEKPTGTPDEQRNKQNSDAARAYARRRHV